MTRFQRWNSWTAFSVKVPGYKLESSVFFSGFLPSFFPFTKCYSWIDSSLFFREFLCKDFWEEYGFLWNPLVEETVECHGAKDSSLLVTWCPRIPSRDNKFWFWFLLTLEWIRRLLSCRVESGRLSAPAVSCRRLTRAAPESSPHCMRFYTGPEYLSLLAKNSS